MSAVARMRLCFHSRGTREKEERHTHTKLVSSFPFPSIIAVRKSASTLNGNLGGWGKGLEGGGGGGVETVLVAKNASWFRVHVFLCFNHCILVMHSFNKIGLIHQFDS